MRLVSWARSALPPAGPARTFAASYFAASIGLGLYVPAITVYFVRSVGFTPTQVGIGLSIAGLMGLLSGLLIGNLSDRIGAREVTLGLTALLVPLLLAVTQIRSFWQFPVVVGPLAMALSGSDVSREALIGRAFERSATVRVSAYSRVALNAGFSVGLLAAGLVIGVNTGPAYRALFVADAAITLVTFLLCLRLPSIPGSGLARGTGDTHAIPLGDLPYLLMAQVSGLTRLEDPILTIGLPLWVIDDTSAPKELAAWLIILNTVIVILFQVRAVGGASTVAGATLMQRRAFIVLAASCFLLGWTARLSAVPAIALLVAAAILLTFGELWGEGASWAMRYLLTPQDAQGRYGGVFNLRLVMPTVLGPVMVTALTGDLKMTGWLILAGIFLGGMSVHQKVITWTERTDRHSPATSRTAYHADTESNYPG